MDAGGDEEGGWNMNDHLMASQSEEQPKAEPDEEEQEIAALAAKIHELFMGAYRLNG